MSDGCGCGEEARGLPAGSELRLLLRFLSEYLAPRDRYEQTLAMQQAATGDASGDATLDLGTPVAGTFWLLERYSWHASAGAPSFGLFVGPQTTTDPMFRRDFFPSTAGVSDATSDLAAPVHVGVGENLTVRFAGASASAALTVALQVQVRRVTTPALA